MPRLPILLVFLAVVIGGGLLIGFTIQPHEWYAALAKPPFNPPNWVFAPVWTLLYVMIAFAGARTFERGFGIDLALWVAQLVLNFAWTPVFFGLHQIGAGLVVIIALLGAILVFMATRWNADRLSALLFAPYAAWVAFATLLNASILALN
jgi:tryptophan-rich sensory protein